MVVMGQYHSEEKNMFQQEAQTAETVVFEDALHAARTAYEAGFRVCGVWDVSAEEDQAALKALADWYVRDLGDWVP